MPALWQSRCRGRRPDTARPAPMPPLHELSATALSALYRRGEVSPLEVARDLVAHVTRCEPHLHALWAFDADAVLAAARGSEARWRRGEPLSPLDGVPCTIKENVATRGTPVPLGSAATDLVPAAADAPPAARLREAGCVLLAKTTMPDYGMLSSGLSSFHALTRNPWQLAKNPGGSSAGAAAAAAAGYGPLHLGTASAARSACRRAGAGSSVSSRARGACRSTRLTTVASRGQSPATSTTPRR